MFERPARQKDDNVTGNASLAVDGDPATCSVTRAGVPGWWAVTLDSEIDVRTITIVSRRTLWLFSYFTI